MFGSDSLSGATQVAMMVIAFFTALIGLKNGISWHEIEKSIVRSSTKTTGPILIFLSIGALIGSLMLSGAVPSLLYYGLNILSPTYFYPLTCLICALVAICIGSSWTTAATIGVALMGVSYGFALSPEITAGAIISGAYFGDKMSPLSETTNLAPSIAGSDLFEHIRHMAWVSVPSFVIAVFAFFAIGLNTAVTQGSQTSIDAFIQTLDQHFDISPINLIPVVLLLWLAVKKTPAFLAIIARVPNVGARVVQLSYDVLLEIYQIRESLEGLAARLAAETMTGEEKLSLRALLTSHHKHLLDTQGQSYFQQEGDVDFHYRIIHGSKNQRLIDMLAGDLYQLVRMYRYQFSWSSNRPQQALKEHDQICSAIEESDGELAEWLMKRHINNARNNILASMNHQKHPNLEKYHE